MAGKQDKVKKALPDDKEIKQEYERLFDLFANADEDQLELAKGEIAQAAFLKVTLDRLSDDVVVNGFVEEYQNGENQSGKKESTAAKLHNQYMKNYVSVMKQLHDFLDKIKPQETVEGGDKDEFEGF